MNTIVRMEFGSHLYGTNTAMSDHDYKSVYVPTGKDILLQRVKDSTGHKVKRVEGDKNSPEDTDDEAYSLQRYLNLLAQGQTVSLDMLFVPASSLLLTSDIWSEIRSNKNLLLTKKSASFVGYCRTQANKYGIKGSRVASVKAVVDLFREEIERVGSNAKLGEIDFLFPKIANEHTKVIEIIHPNGNAEQYLDCCNRKIGYKTTLKEGLKVFEKIYDNYGKRAKQAENNEGVDWKALSHAVRVGNEAIELLTTHNITFPLLNREHILDIKQGRLTYEQVAEEIDQLLIDVEKASLMSTLREEADYEFIDDLVYHVYKQSVEGR